MPRSFGVTRSLTSIEFYWEYLYAKNEVFDYYGPKFMVKVKVFVLMTDRQTGQTLDASEAHFGGIEL